MTELDVRVACAQIAPSVEDPRRNRALTRDAVREAVSAGARLVVLPELSTSGYVPRSAQFFLAGLSPGPP